MNLRAHLGLHAGLGSGFGNDSALMDVAGKRLFAIDVLLGLQGGQGGESMGMLSRGNDDRIDVIDLFVEVPKVLVGPSSLAPGKASGPIQIFLVHVAKGNHLLVTASRDVASTASPYSDEAYRQLAVGRL